MSSPVWDLVVVGAGPAGAAAAIHSAPAGLQVVVVDTAHFPRQKVCGEYMTQAAWRLLGELGAGELQARAVSLPRMELAASELHRATLDFPDADDCPRSLSRYVLDARLVDEAR